MIFNIEVCGGFTVELEVGKVDIDFRYSRVKEWWYYRVMEREIVNILLRISWKNLGCLLGCGRWG